MKTNNSKSIPQILAAVITTGLLITHVYGSESLSSQLSSESDIGQDQTFKQDRAAILSMAGNYKVNFKFEETLAVRPGYHLSEPYQSSGVEWVSVLEDSGNRIVLQHILVGCDQDKQTDDLSDKCFPIKHWRQDWTFQDIQILTYKGSNTWEKIELEPSMVKGTWSQEVSQVDDSPRYEGYGRWKHTGNQSVWQSETTWRPLPRREYTHRDDYDVLVATNKHIITPNGWYHEQDNFKLDLQRQLDQPVIAREFGLNSYLPTAAPQLQVARDYMDDTQVFWKQVRAWWSSLQQEHNTLEILASHTDKKMYEVMFELADNSRSIKTENLAEIRAKIDQTLVNYLKVK